MSTHQLATQLQLNNDAPMISNHSILINAPIETVWETLADFENWCDWNDEIVSVKLLGEVSKDTTFVWKSNGATIKSRIARLDKPNTLAWSGKVLWIRAIHIWKLVESDDGVQVEVSESMEGFLSTLIVGQKKLDETLSNWLRALKTRCEA
jgi:uncharacterized membrane protein